MKGEILLPQHAKPLVASAISEKVAGERGYWSASKAKELERLFGSTQRRAPALVIPIYNVAGELQFHQLRPDVPRVINGRTLKYWTPTRARYAVDEEALVERLLRKYPDGEERR